MLPPKNIFPGGMPLTPHQQLFYTDKQCDQVFSGEITTSGFRNYYIRAKITTVPYFSNFSRFFHIFPENVGEGGGEDAKKIFRRTFFPENHVLN
jgi:hypothetical protein